MKKNLSKKVKTITQVFFRKMVFAAEVDVTEKDSTIKINISCPDSALLIGRYGETLKSLQLILATIIYNQLKPKTPVRILVDIDNYRNNQNKQIEEMGERAAQAVLKYKKPEVLRPMNSYERKIIHTIVSQKAGLETASIGEEPERRIIIKLKGSS